MRKKKRLDIIGRIVAPVPRFWGALIALPGFLLIDNILWRGLFMILFVALAFAAGKSIQWLYFLILIASVTFFHLLAPLGRVLMRIGPLTVTEGALHNGLSRGMGLAGMVFLSVAAICPELELPGQFGGLLGRTFYYFNTMMEWRGRINWKDFFGSLDRLLVERFSLQEEDTDGRISGKATGITGLGWALFGALLPWTVWVFIQFDIL